MASRAVIYNSKFARLDWIIICLTSLQTFAMLSGLVGSKQSKKWKVGGIEIHHGLRACAFVRAVPAHASPCIRVHLLIDQ